MLGPHDIVGLASQLEYKALLTLRLRHLLESQPGWGPGRARNVLRRMAETLGREGSLERATVQWLLDSRARGRRLLAWTEALERAEEILPEGFPFGRLESDGWPVFRPWLELDPGNTPLAALHSRSPVKGHHRLDPFYDDLFDSGATTESYSVAQLRAARVRLPSAIVAEAEDALAALFGELHRTDALMLVGAIHAWRGLLPQQAAAIIGRPQVASVRRPELYAAAAAGVVDVGIPRGRPVRKFGGDDVVWRAAAGPAFKRSVLPKLTAIERASVLGGRPWLGSPGYDRHMVLSAELGLRAAEYLPEIGAVLGEQFSGVKSLGLIRPDDFSRFAHDHKAGDLTIVRYDGLRIVVELTANPNQIQKKVAAWARLLAANALDLSGIVVLFLDAEPGGRGVRSELEKHIAATCRSASSTVQGRLLVASWADWFPSAHMASQDFASMRARAPAWPHTSTWIDVQLTSMPFDPEPEWDPIAVIGWAALLTQTPAWLRSAATVPDPIGLLVDKTALRRDQLPDGDMSIPARLRWPGL